MGTYSVLAAYAGIVILTAILILMNVRSAIREYKIHCYRPRLASQMVAVTLVGAMLITLSYFVIDRTMDAALSVQEDSLQRQMPMSLKKT